MSFPDSPSIKGPCPCLPFSKPQLKWGGSTLLVAAFVFAFFAVGGFLASSHLLPGALAWMNVGAIGNALLLTATIASFLLGMAALVFSCHKTPAPIENESDTMCKQEESSAIASRKVILRKKGTKAPIEGKVVVQFPETRNRHINFGPIGQPGEGVSQEQFYSDVDYSMGGQVRRMDGKEWRDNPEAVVVRCLIFGTPSHKKHPLADENEIFLPLELFIQGDDYEHPKANGEKIAFTFNGIAYSLEIAQENTPQQKAFTGYPRTNFGSLYAKINQKLPDLNGKVVTFQRACAWDLTFEKEEALPMHSLQKQAGQNRKVNSYLAHCTQKVLRRMPLGNPLVPKYRFEQDEHSFTIAFRHDFASNIQFAVNKKHLAVHATEPPSKAPAHSEYLVVLPLPKGAQEDNIHMSSASGICQIKITPPHGKMDEWLAHFSSEMEQLFEEFGEP